MHGQGALVIRNKLFVGTILIKNGTISMKFGTIAMKFGTIYLIQQMEQNQ